MKWKERRKILLNQLKGKKYIAMNALNLSSKIEIDIEKMTAFLAMKIEWIAWKTILTYIV